MAEYVWERENAKYIIQATNLSEMDAPIGKKKVMSGLEKKNAKHIHIKTLKI